MASAADILAKRNQPNKNEKSLVDKLTKPAETAAVKVNSKGTQDISQTWTPKKRICSYTSRALNAEISLGNNTSFKFVGNFYTTDKSIEIYELDSLCKRMPNVFSKVEVN